MIFRMKRGSHTHRNWQTLKNRVVGGLQYSWRQLKINDVGYIEVSLDENLDAMSFNPRVHIASGVNVSTGNVITAERLVEILDEETVKLLVESLIDPSKYYRPLVFNYSNPNLRELVFAFRWAIVTGPPNHSGWTAVGNILHRESLQCIS